MKRPLILVALLLRVLVLSAHEDKLTEGYWQIAGKHGMAVSNHGAFENETNLYLEKQDIAKPDAYKSIDNNDTGNPNGNAVIQWTTTIGNPNQTWVL